MFDILDFVDIFDKMLAGGYDFLLSSFTPVTVTRGRKFKGFGYVTGSYIVDNGGYSGSGVRPRLWYAKYHVWNPEKKERDEFNGNPRSTSECISLSSDAKIEENVDIEKLRSNFHDYMMSLIEVASKSCGKNKNYMVNWFKKALNYYNFEILNELVDTVVDIAEAEE